MRWALTPPFQPCLIAEKSSTIGGIFSVALSVNVFRHCPGVTWQRALWSPDFPRTFNDARDHPTDSIQKKDNSFLS
jgi:hypothetical protein